MNDAIQRRVAANEALFREANEVTERGQRLGDESSTVAFQCECARLSCDRLIYLTPLAYERVRALPRRFVVLPGHEVIEGEEIVESQPGYLVVEKHDEAGRLAEALDPRA